MNLMNFLALNSFVDKYNLFVKAYKMFPLYLSSLSSSDQQRDLDRFSLFAVCEVGKIKEVFGVVWIHFLVSNKFPSGLISWITTTIIPLVF